MNDMVRAPIVRPFLLRFPLREQAMFAKRLAMMLRGGIPLMQGLHMLRQGAASRHARYIFGSLLRDVSDGRSLAHGMESLRGTFGAFAIGIVHTGEASGTLAESLEYLAEELKRSAGLRRTLLGSLAYPAIIMLATLGISLGLTMYVFPKITPIFESFDARLPVTTRVLIIVSDTLARDWPLFLCDALALVVGAYAMARIPRVRRRMDRAVLALPVVGALMRAYELANTARALALLVGAGVRVPEAFALSARGAHNAAYRAALSRIAADVATGKPASDGLAQYPRLFPPLVAQMARTGEEAGGLAPSLSYLGAMYEEDARELARSMTTMIEPLLMLAMGAIVGFIALAIVTPIYSMTQQLQMH